MSTFIHAHQVGESVEKKALYSLIFGGEIHSIWELDEFISHLNKCRSDLPETFPAWLGAVQE